MPSWEIEEPNVENVEGICNDLGIYITSTSLVALTIAKYYEGE